MKPKGIENKEAFIVVKNDGGEIIMEHFDRLLDWLDDPTVVRGRLVFRGGNAVDDANPLLNVGETIWWSPDNPQLILECTHLDDLAKQNVARVRAAILTLPPTKAGDKAMIVLWDDLGGVHLQYGGGKSVLPS